MNNTSYFENVNVTAIKDECVSCIEKLRRLRKANKFIKTPLMAGCFLSFGLVEPKADAADISPARFELGYIWSEADEAAFFKFGL